MNYEAGSWPQNKKGIMKWENAVSTKMTRDKHGTLNKTDTVDFDKYMEIICGIY